jgi:hypothetical protein
LPHSTGRQTRLKVDEGVSRLQLNMTGFRHDFEVLALIC